MVVEKKTRDIEYGVGMYSGLALNIGSKSILFWRRMIQDLSIQYTLHTRSTSDSILDDLHDPSRTPPLHL